MSIGALMGVEALYDEELCHKFMLMSGTGHYTHSVKLANTTLDRVCAAAEVSRTHIGDFLSSCTTAKLMAIQNRMVHESAKASLISYLRGRRNKFRFLRRFLGESAIFSKGDGMLPVSGLGYIRGQTENENIEKVFPFFPVFEAGDSLLPEHPEVFVKKRIAAGKPLIPLFIGHTNAESTLFSNYLGEESCMENLVPRLEKLLSTIGGHTLPPELENVKIDVVVHRVGNSYYYSRQLSPTRSPSRSPRFARRFEPIECPDMLTEDPRHREMDDELLTTPVENGSFRESEAPTSRSGSFCKPVVVSVSEPNPVPKPQSARWVKKRVGGIIKAYTEGRYVNRLKTSRPVWDAIHTDWLFRLPAERIASVYAHAGHTAFVYRFQHRCPVAGLDAPHQLDLHYVFGTWNSPPYLTMGYTPRMAESSRQVRHDFLEFIRQPANKLSELNAKHPERWVPWNSETRPVKVYAETPTDEIIGYFTSCKRSHEEDAEGNCQVIATMPHSVIRMEHNTDQEEVESWGPTMEHIVETLSNHREEVE